VSVTQMLVQKCEKNNVANFVCISRSTQHAVLLDLCSTQSLTEITFDTSITYELF